MRAQHTYVIYLYKGERNGEGASGCRNGYPEGGIAGGMLSHGRALSQYYLMRWSAQWEPRGGPEVPRDVYDQRFSRLQHRDKHRTQPING